MSVEDQAAVYAMREQAWRQAEDYLAGFEIIKIGHVEALPTHVAAELVRMAIHLVVGEILTRQAERKLEEPQPQQ